MDKEKKYSLYRHTSPSGKVYIGITSQPVEHRWNHGRGYMNIKKTAYKFRLFIGAKSNVHIDEILHGRRGRKIVKGWRVEYAAA